MPLCKRGTDVVPGREAGRRRRVSPPAGFRSGASEAQGGCPSSPPPRSRVGPQRAKSKLSEEREGGGPGEGERGTGPERRKLAGGGRADAFGGGGAWAAETERPRNRGPRSGEAPSPPPAYWRDTAGGRGRSGPASGGRECRRSRPSGRRTRMRDDCRTASHASFSEGGSRVYKNGYTARGPMFRRRAVMAMGVLNKIDSTIRTTVTMAKMSSDMQSFHSVGGRGVEVVQHFSKKGRGRFLV